MIIVDEVDSVAEEYMYTFFLESRDCVARAINELLNNDFVVGCVQQSPPGKPHVTIHLQGTNFSKIDYARSLIEDIRYYENNVVKLTSSPTHKE